MVGDTIGVLYVEYCYVDNLNLFMAYTKRYNFLG